jgi:hypothetical protein
MVANRTLRLVEAWNSTAHLLRWRSRVHFSLLPIPRLSPPHALTFHGRTSYHPPPTDKSNKPTARSGSTCEFTATINKINGRIYYPQLSLLTITLLTRTLRSAGHILSWRNWGIRPWTREEHYYKRTQLRVTDLTNCLVGSCSKLYLEVLLERAVDSFDLSLGGG